jgi:hypothetical protein
MRAPTVGPAGEEPMPEYAFDATVRIAIRVNAASEQEARNLLDRHLDCADANFGAWPDGDPIMAEASLWDRPRVFEIDGEPYEPFTDDDEDCIRRAEDDGAVFGRNSETGLWSVRSDDEEWVVTEAPSQAKAARLYCKEMRV